MIVAELIELLQQEDPNSPVHYAYNYGDYWRTQVAPKVTEVFTGKVTYSDYHRMDKVIDEYECDDDDESKNSTQVVILG